MVWDASENVHCFWVGQFGPALPAFSPFSKKAEGIMWKKQNTIRCCPLSAILRFLLFQGFTNSVPAKLRVFFFFFPISTKKVP